MAIKGRATTFALGALSRASRGTALLRGMDNNKTFIGLATTPATHATV